MIATRLTLLCHAPTQATRTFAFPLDEPIEPASAKKVLAMAPSLDRADRVWVSPAQRARETANLLDLPATTEPALGECNYGR